MVSSVRVAIDTLGLARRLRERAGFTPEHAEEAAQAIAETMVDQVATRADLAELRGAVTAEIAELKADLTRLVSTVATGQVALLLAAMFSVAWLAH
jgi:hypothetical protein